MSNTSVSNVSTRKAGRREWIGLAVLTLPNLLISIDTTVLHLATPALSADLRPSASQLLWISDIYGFLIAGSLITMGTLGDRIGRRKLLLIGAAAFGIASILAAYAPSAEMLILARGILGVAGATLMPSTMSLIRNMFHDPRQRTTALSVWMTGFMTGGALGPLVGGLLLEFFWWGSAFLIGVPVMALLLLLGPWLLPEYRDPKAGRLDLISAALSVVAVLAMIFGLKEIATEGLSRTPILALLVGLLIGAVFIHRQRRLEDPLLDLSLFTNHAFSASLTALMLLTLVGPGIGFLVGQYLQLVLGMTPLEAGLWSLPVSASVVVGFLSVPTLLRRLPPPPVVGVGLVLSALGVGLLTLAEGIAVVVTGQALFFLGAAPMFVMGLNLIVGAAPPERSGTASAVSETGQEFGAALGLAVLGSIAAAIYRTQMRDTAVDGIPAEAADAARDTLGGATAVAQQLPSDLATALLGRAQEAFADGLQWVAGISAAIVLIAAVFATIVLRRIPTPGPSSSHEEPTTTSELELVH